jgi:hypothetical protein
MKQKLKVRLAMWLLGLAPSEVVAKYNDLRTIISIEESRLTQALGPVHQESMIMYLCKKHLDFWYRLA